MHTTLATDHGMDLIEYHRLQGAQHATSALGGQEQVEALRRRNQNLRRLPQHAPPVFWWCVSGTCHRTDDGEGNPVGFEVLSQLLERCEQIATNVVVERSQWRYIEHTRVAFRPLTRNELVESPQEGSECLTRFGWRGDQYVFIGGNVRPCRGLRVGGCANLLAEPALKGRVK